MSMHALCIAGNRRRGGKTVLAVGLIAYLRASGLTVQPFKIGQSTSPDLYLLTEAAGRDAIALDPRVLSPQHLVDVFTRGCAAADVAILEARADLYDEAEGAPESTSSAAVAKLLGVPVLLLLDSATRKSKAEVLALHSLDPALVAGVALTRVPGGTQAGVAWWEGSLSSTKSSLPLVGNLGDVVGEWNLPATEHWTKRQALFASNLNLAVGEDTGVVDETLGAHGRDDHHRDVRIRLAQRFSSPGPCEEIYAAREAVERDLDLVVLRALAATYPGLSKIKVPAVVTSSTATNTGTNRWPGPPDANTSVTSTSTSTWWRGDVKHWHRRRARIGVAIDEAFSHVDVDQLSLLERAGAEVVLVSPLRDTHLPKGLDGVWLSNPPQLSNSLLSKLASNASWLRSLGEFARRGGAVKAEGLGVVLVAARASVGDADGANMERRTMAGIFPWGVVLTHGDGHDGARRSSTERVVRPGGTNKSSGGSGNDGVGHPCHEHERVVEVEVLEMLDGTEGKNMTRLGMTRGVTDARLRRAAPPFVDSYLPTTRAAENGQDSERDSERDNRRGRSDQQTMYQIQELDERGEAVGAPEWDGFVTQRTVASLVRVTWSAAPELLLRWVHGAGADIAREGKEKMGGYESDEDHDGGPHGSTSSSAMGSARSPRGSISDHDYDYDYNQEQEQKHPSPSPSPNNHLKSPLKTVFSEGDIRGPSAYSESVWRSKEGEGRSGESAMDRLRIDDTNPLTTNPSNKHSQATAPDVHVNKQDQHHHHDPSSPSPLPPLVPSTSPHGDAQPSPHSSSPSPHHPSRGHGHVRSHSHSQSQESGARSPGLPGPLESADGSRHGSGLRLATALHASAGPVPSHQAPGPHSGPSKHLRGGSFAGSGGGSSVGGGGGRPPTGSSATWEARGRMSLQDARLNGAPGHPLSLRRAGYAYIKNSYSNLQSLDADDTTSQHSAGGGVGGGLGGVEGGFDRTSAHGGMSLLPGSTSSSVRGANGGGVGDFAGLGAPSPTMGFPYLQHTHAHKHGHGHGYSTAHHVNHSTHPQHHMPSWRSLPEYLPINPADAIVSLCPAGTEVLCALGLADRIVAVTDRCDAPELGYHRVPIVATHGRSRTRFRSQSQSQSRSLAATTGGTNGPNGGDENTTANTYHPMSDTASTTGSAGNGHRGGSDYGGKSQHNGVSQPSNNTRSRADMLYSFLSRGGRAGGVHGSSERSPSEAPSSVRGRPLQYSTTSADDVALDWIDGAWIMRMGIGLVVVPPLDQGGTGDGMGAMSPSGVAVERGFGASPLMTHVARQLLAVGLHPSQQPSSRHPHVAGTHLDSPGGPDRRRGPRVFVLPGGSVDAALSSISALGEEIGGKVAARAEEVEDRYRERLRRCTADWLPRRRRRPRVLLLQSVEPLVAGGEWRAEVVQLAGGETLRHGPYPDPTLALTWDDVREFNPEVILVAPVPGSPVALGGGVGGYGGGEGYGTGGVGVGGGNATLVGPSSSSIQTMLDDLSEYLATQRGFWSLDAVHRGHVYVLGEGFGAALYRQGPRLVLAVEVVTALLEVVVHGDTGPWRKVLAGLAGQPRGGKGGLGWTGADDPWEVVRLQLKNGARCRASNFKHYFSKLR